MRRSAAFALVTILLAATQIASPSAAHAIGAIVPPPDSKVSVPDERSIVSWDGKEERITMMLDVRTTARQIGFIVPTPTPATVTAGDSDVFGVIERLIQPTVLVTDDWFGTSLLPQPKPPAEPAILKRVQLGKIEATTLAASDVDGLALWFADNGFVSPEHLSTALTSYVSLGWSFTVIKLKSLSNLDGRLDPVTITFATDELIYPMELSSLVTTPQSVRLYVFDKQRDSVAQANRPTVDLDSEVQVVWAGEVGNPTLRQLGAHLTVIDIHFEHPNKQITDDIGIVVSADPSMVKPTEEVFRVISLIGIPVGTLIIVWVLLGIAIVVAFLSWRRRAS
jgi:hypothetical protein